MSVNPYDQDYDRAPEQIEDDFILWERELAQNGHEGRTDTVPPEGLHSPDGA